LEKIASGGFFMKKRLIGLGVLFSFLAVLLVARLTLIQILESERYVSANAEQQRILLKGEDTRGTIYDRNGEPITGADESYIYIIKRQNIDVTAARLLERIGAERVKNDSSSRYFVYRSGNFNKDTANLLQKKYGAFIITGTTRYGATQPAAHLIGYINEKDGTGVAGLEKGFNSILAKKQKVVYASVDGKRMIIPGLGISSTIADPDCSVTTTLDLAIQKKAEQVLSDAGRNGSIIVLDARNGDVLAGASSPSYDPAHVDEYLQSNKEELVNKVTQSLYPPGSIFKIVVAAAALESGAVTEDSIFLCKGYEEINGIRIKCSKEEGHGTLDFHDAFAKSCNSAFIQIGMKTGGDAILAMADKFGVGKNAFHGLIEEKEGTLPGTADIQGAGIGNLSIGQGKLLVTPAQAARITEIIASGGIDYGLTLIKSVTAGGKTFVQPRTAPNRIIKKETADLITQLMVDTVNYGTANNLTESGITIAGKTGSAEASYHGEKVVHGWFTGFFPAEDPRYVITVFVESGGSGRGSAVPLFRQMTEYLDDQSRPN
jgi:peptidoglycan glycosyltransferase/penicillin-binding protein 2